MKKEPYKVLVVDDSPLITRMVSEIINSDSELRVMGIAGDPFEATRLLNEEIPDVILLDIEMPLMDGITFLKKIMSQHPLPVVIFSAVAEKNSKNALDALHFGALDVVQKPKNLIGKAFEEMKSYLTDALKAAVLSKGKLNLLRTSNNSIVKKTVSGREIRFMNPDENLFHGNERLIFMGASTGGTQAIEFLLSRLSPPLPAILIIQHMPGGFTRSFAERLNDFSALNVKEAEDGELVKNNCVYIANGFYHMLLSKIGFQYRIRQKEGPLMNRHKPSVDILFKSAARHAGPHGIGILLTGMGDDGARGLLKMKEAGAFTIAQDEKSAVVWGMPGSAVKMGAALKVYSQMEILNFLNALKYSKKN